MDKFPELLRQVVGGRSLAEAEAAVMVEEILGGEMSEARMGAWLAAMATKGETVAELVGAATAMRRHAARIQATGGEVMDTCGTGGDGGGTFNISTAAALVAAGAGAVVAKHGNRSVSSRCGSADVLEKLGLDLAAPPEIMEEALNSVGLTFMFAPMFHGAVRHVMPVRGQLGIRSIFNMLGPLTNPAGAARQLIGVYAPELTEMFAEALLRLGARRAMVVHGHDGMDEITLTGPTRVSELRDGRVVTYDLELVTLGLEPVDPAALAGGDAEDNARIITSVLDGESGPCRDIVRLNAAAALVVGGLAPDLAGGWRLAGEALDSGAARAKLRSLVDFVREHG